MEIDTRGSHFYLALYWAEALANQDKSAELKSTFEKVYAELSANEGKITEELIESQGGSKDIGGYYLPDAAKAAAALRPSTTLNAILDTI